ncbi:MAG: hypothetical protein LC122_04835 [Chitinophagales bacterium]|nr:hypothetical protein [Chitinophagales bacterium]
MKTENKKLLAPLTKTELKNLTSETKETVSTESEPQKKNFCAADLWNIRKTRKVFVERRGYFGW